MTTTEGKKKVFRLKADQLEYSLALICARVLDQPKNGLPQYEIAKRMHMGPTALSYMLNFKRFVRGEDVFLYCKAKGNKTSASEYIDLARQMKKQNKIHKMARAFMKKTDRKERVNLRKELHQAINTFVLYEREKRTEQSLGQ